VRTTLTIDPDVERLLEQEMARLRRPLKEVVNDALRRGLTRGSPTKQRPIVLQVHDSRLRAGYDPATFNALADELQDASVIAKITRNDK